MKTVSCWEDLRPFGISALTGEACGMMYRILFDVTDQGRRALAKCLGVPGLQLAGPWNRGDPADPHVGSVLLTGEMFTPLAIFALLEGGCDEVWLRKDGWLVGFEPVDSPERRQAHLTLLRGHLVRRFACGG